MKIEIQSSVIITLTAQEASALVMLLGKMSINEMRRIGLSDHQAQLNQAMYYDLEKPLSRHFQNK